MISKTPRIKVIISILVVLLATATWFPMKTRATSISVTTTVDEMDGSSGNGNCSLREALRNANYNNGNQVDCPAGSGNDVIHLRGSTYTLTLGGPGEDYGNEGDLDIFDGTTILGFTTGRPTIIQAGTSDPTDGSSGNSIDRVLHITNDSYVYIHDVTIRYGDAPDGAVGLDGEPGGGIYNEGNLQLWDCFVEYNRSGDGLPGNSGPGGFGGAGGGIYSDDSLYLYRTQVMNNRAGDGGDGDAGFNGGGGGSGGGIFLGAYSGIHVEDSNIDDNTAGAGGNGGDTTGSDAGHGSQGGPGGGLYCHDCSMYIENSTVLRNTSGAGGNGGDVHSGTGDGGNGGQGGSGGGLLLNGFSASSSLIDTTVGDNSTGLGGIKGTGDTGSDGSDGFRGGGGGLEYINDSGGTFKTSTLHNNTGLAGGGIEVVGGSNVTLINSTISGNYATEGGGGMRIYGTGSSAIMLFVTLTANDTDGDGGGFKNDASLTMFNTIVAENTAPSHGNPDCYGSASSIGNNLLGIENSANCSFTPSTGDIYGSLATPLDPGLLGLNDNGGLTWTHAFGKTSPAIDHITDSGIGCGTVYKFDQRGVIRFSPCDIGAYEKNQAEHIYTPLIFR
jgi:CSLREA domain-containing protein